MKNLPLAAQIWMLCAAVTLSISLLIMLFLPGMLQEFFTQQVLSILEDSQKNIQVSKVTVVSNNIQVGKVTVVSATLDETIPHLKISTEDEAVNTKNTIVAESDSSTIDITQSKRRNLPEGGVLAITFPPNPALPNASLPFMNHFFFSEDMPLPANSLPEPFYKQVMYDSAHQVDSVQKYTQVIDDKTLLYVISKTNDNDITGNLISYSWGSYRNDMAGILYRQLMLLMLVIFILSWIPSLLVSRHLTRPLVKMENQVLKIGSKEWGDPLDFKRGDEIGRLANAFENMRQRLLRQDQAQQSYLQNISHSLKTPIMVIQSYTKAILDGIYPKGTLEASLLTIQNEADRTNKMVQDILMLNKIKYFSTRDFKMESVVIKVLIEEIADKLHTQRPDLNWKLELADYCFAGDPDQWKIVLENLMDNATRYAAATIHLSLQPDSRQDWWLRIWNDGLPVDDAHLEKIFEEYCTGQGGQSGLGLAIVHHIVDLHQGRVWAANENNGVAFYIA